MKAKKTVGTIITSVGFAVGFAALSSASPGSITNTGPDSNNEITHSTYSKLKVENDTELKVNNDNDQRASSGDATTRHNTTGGGAMTGDAYNENSTSVSATIRNSAPAPALLSPASGGGSGSASIHQTGPDSNNEITTHMNSEVYIENDTELHVYNDNDQHAYSGDAVVQDNTTGGSATSGDAMNTNNTTVTLNVSN